jgi:hypothetical protein
MTESYKFNNKTQTLTITGKKRGEYIVIPR